MGWKQKTAWIMFTVVGSLILVAYCGALVLPSLLSDANPNRAKMDVRTLENAASAFKDKYDRYPNSIDELVTPPGGADPFIMEEILFDPWSERYILDPKQTHPTTKVPLIYSKGPLNEPRIISNWETKN